MATVQNRNGNTEFRFVIKKIKDKLEVYPLIPKTVSLGSVRAVYRNLRENYEFRLRYDEAGKLFIKEMELKRKYLEVPSKDNDSSGIMIKPLQYMQHMQSNNSSKLHRIS